MTQCTRRFPIEDHYEQCPNEATVQIFPRSGINVGDQLFCTACKDDLLESRPDLAEQVTIVDLI